MVAGIAHFVERTGVLGAFCAFLLSLVVKDILSELESHTARLLVLFIIIVSVYKVDDFLHRSR